MSKNLFERRVTKMGNTRLTTTHNNKTGKTSTFCEAIYI